MTIAPQVAISESFLTALARLPKPLQKKAREFTTKFRTNPTSAAINYESIHGMRDPKVRTVRIDQQYRAVVVHPETGNLYMLVWVDNHDEAMAWAQHKVFDINATTGAIQVVDMQFVEQATAAVAPTAAPAPSGLFAALSDGDLARTGLPGVLVPAVRAVRTDDELEKLQPYLPQEAFEALYLIAAGYDLDRAIRESSRPPIAAPKPVDTTDFAAALEKPATRRQFRLVGSEDELVEMLDASLDKWRVFLHPNQEAIVRTNYRGPARVLGGAGTGKTVVAMHRARHLAKLYPGEKILFTAFNRNLAANISGLLDTLCGPERARIDVANVHSWAVKYAGTRWGTVTIVSPPQADECWKVALGQGRAALGWTQTDYEGEWDDVVQFHGVTSRDDYLKASRAGCPKTLKRTERVAIWEGLAAFRAELDRRKLMDWPDIVRKVRQHLETKGDTPYRAIVVDEAQDIDAEQWRLLRVLAPGADNSLFITGDGHQRIYGKPITLSQFGINIRGRSHRLKINYRTTEQVLRWATKLLAGAEIDDLDGGTDNTVGYRSLYTGPEPEVHTFGSATAETAFLIERVRALASESPPEEIAVVAKTKSRVRTYADALDAAGVAHTILDSDGDGAGPGVRLATMHRVKGLDFTHVVMHMPAGTSASRDPRDQSLLYVAATRCRKTLTVLERA
jgi:hypothetical protein